MKKLSEIKIGIVGLGYVGLPLASLLAEKYSVVGFDINQKRIDELMRGVDVTGELSSSQVQASSIRFTTDSTALLDCNVYIVTVPTPVDELNIPDLDPLIKASKLVSNVLKKGDLVIYESTVYPGATEEVCVPILEQGGRLRLNVDFHVGYSPERINPGDKVNRIKNIQKITSGSSSRAASLVDKIYKSVIDAGTFMAPSIKIAESAKVIENIQRDVNIALINELSIIFDKLDIDTNDVLDAAATKWNFIDLRPGLVGGHCIGVDPYYLLHKAEKTGYVPDIISSARRLNSSMAEYVCQRFLTYMAEEKISLVDSRILICGFTFKENCPDTRNTQVIHLYSMLTRYGCLVDVYEPVGSLEEIKSDYGVEAKDYIAEEIKYDAVIVAVSHAQIREISNETWNKRLRKKRVIFDLKNCVDRKLMPRRL